MYGQTQGFACCSLDPQTYNAAKSSLGCVLFKQTVCAHGMDVQSASAAVLPMLGRSHSSCRQQLPNSQACSLCLCSLVWLWFMIPFLSSQRSLDSQLYFCRRPDDTSVTSTQNGSDSSSSKLEGMMRQLSMTKKARLTVSTPPVAPRRLWSLLIKHVWWAMMVWWVEWSCSTFFSRLCRKIELRLNFVAYLCAYHLLEPVCIQSWCCVDIELGAWPQTRKVAILGITWFAYHVKQSELVVQMCQATMQCDGVHIFPECCLQTDIIGCNVQEMLNTLLNDGRGHAY